MKPLKKEQLVAGREYCAVLALDLRRVEWTGKKLYDHKAERAELFDFYDAVYPLPADVQRPTLIDAINFVNFYRMEANHDKRAKIFNAFADKFCEKED